MGDKGGPERRDSDPNVSNQEMDEPGVGGGHSTDEAGNAGGGKGPCFWCACKGTDGERDWR